MKAQRLRIRYAITAEASDLGQREMVDAWQHACREAAIPLAFSEGKRASPQISIAAPLPQGVTSTCELLDLYLTETVSPEDTIRRLSDHLPCGIRPIDAHEIGVNAPSLQSQVRFATYVLTVPDANYTAVRNAVDSAISARSLPAEYRRENRVKQYDLRPLILDLRLDSVGRGATVIMRLRAEPERAARADQVAALLGLPEDAQIQRVALETQDVPAVILTYRRSGETGE